MAGRTSSGATQYVRLGGSPGSFPTLWISRTGLTSFPRDVKKADRPSTTERVKSKPPRSRPFGFAREDCACAVHYETKSFISLAVIPQQPVSNGTTFVEQGKLTK